MTVWGVWPTFMTQNLLPQYNTIFDLSIVERTADKVHTRAYAYYTKAALQEARFMATGIILQDVRMRFEPRSVKCKIV